MSCRAAARTHDPPSARHAHTHTRTVSFKLPCKVLPALVADSVDVKAKLLDSCGLERIHERAKSNVPTGSARQPERLGGRRESFRQCCDAFITDCRVAADMHLAPEWWSRPDLRGLDAYQHSGGGVGRSRLRAAAPCHAKPNRTLSLVVRCCLCVFLWCLPRLRCRCRLPQVRLCEDAPPCLRRCTYNTRVEIKAAAHTLIGATWLATMLARLSSSSCACNIPPRLRLQPFLPTRCRTVADRAPVGPETADLEPRAAQTARLRAPSSLRLQGRRR
jgi:hypothetical protein